MPASLRTIFSNPAEPVFGGRPLVVARHATARALRLRVDPRSGAVRLTLPKRASLRAALAWAEGQRAWVEAELAAAAPRIRLVPGTVLDVGGRKLKLVRLQPCSGDGHSRGRAQLRPEPEQLVGCDELLISTDPGLFEARAIRWLKAEARRVLEAETRALAARAGVTVGRVSIGDPRSRWGSCSSGGNIRYSWRLILAPPSVLRFVVAHEVAHRVHMNHGPGFKRLEAELLGGAPGPARAWLRAHGAALHRVGP